MKGLIPSLIGLAPVIAVALSPGVVHAQPIGTFRWQLQPFCNVVTLSVVQQGGVYTLDGFDDQCGAQRRAPTVGLAVLNPDGTVGIGLTIVTTPGGTSVHVDAVINVSTLGGTWDDSLGHNGNFVFTPGAGTSGSARPLSGSGVNLGYQQVSAIQNVFNGNFTFNMTVSCPSGKRAISGGHSVIFGTLNSLQVLESHATPSGDGWRIRGFGNITAQGVAVFSVTAICIIVQ